jgi:TetR/AcrR family transcriptional regulator, cholesterol catabolism regulator
MVVVADGYERLMDVAESLFIERGYAAVKLKHIADPLGVKESSIYYHFPKGKEALFIAVMRRNIERHQKGIQEAIEEAGEEWVEQLKAVGYWLVSQPPIDVMRMSKSDLPSIESSFAVELEEAMYESVIFPLHQILQQAHDKSHAQVEDPDLIAGIFVGMVSSIDVIKKSWNKKSKQEMVDVLIESWVKGLRKT